MTDEEFIRMKLEECSEEPRDPPALEMLRHLLGRLRAAWLARRRTRLSGSR